MASVVCSSSPRCLAVFNAPSPIVPGVVAVVQRRRVLHRQHHRHPGHPHNGRRHVAPQHRLRTDRLIREEPIPAFCSDHSAHIAGSDVLVRSAITLASTTSRRVRRRSPNLPPRTRAPARRCYHLAPPPPPSATSWPKLWVTMSACGRGGEGGCFHESEARNERSGGISRYGAGQREIPRRSQAMP